MVRLRRVQHLSTRVGSRALPVTPCLGESDRLDAGLSERSPSDDDWCGRTDVSGRIVSARQERVSDRARDEG